ISERECISRIVAHLNANWVSDGNKSPGDIFTALYRKLLAVKIEANKRHSAMCFLLSLTDKNVDVIIANGMTNFLKHSKSRTNGSGSITYQRNSNTIPLDTDIYSYDCSQSAEAFGTQALPDYMARPKVNDGMELGKDLALNAIYSFTGVQGSYLKKDVVTGRFKLDNQNTKMLSLGEASMLLRLSELGYYHDRVAKYADPTTGFNAMGVMGQAFMTKLKEELTDFHGDVAQLHDEVIKNRAAQSGKDKPSKQHKSGGEITLLTLLSWYIKPLHRLQWITRIADECQMRKGGDLANAVYKYLDFGHTTVNELAQTLLVAICSPLVRMISKWMLEGGLGDEHGEFFVESMNEVGVDRLWHDKFRLRHNMLPQFISKDLADKILRTGKSINFLREICESTELVRGREELKGIMNNNVAHIFSYTQDTNWHAAMEMCYQQTSKHVLDIMVGPHKLLDHLHGMRRFLLLGQGDFVSLLIENMKEELERKGTDVYAHDLSAMLDAALRCTNTQYDDPEILNHLDVVVQPPFSGDRGWDIISLQYVVQGPLATMLEPTMPLYKALFKPLWRMKHMEFVISMRIWKEQMGNAKLLRDMNNETGKTSYRLHLFTSEIMHFIHQVQYYVLFEVIECNWVELQKKMLAATALDDILEAHQNFLHTIKQGCFVNTASDMEGHLEMVYENITALEVWQKTYYENCFKEQEARKVLARQVKESEGRGKFGVTATQRFQRDQERKIFDEKMSSAGRGLDAIATAYEKAVSGFLLALNSSIDPNLQLFGTRLDFNEYYKKRDVRLSKPLTFEHMRMSCVLSMSSKTPCGRF
ncbi:hypothetical protein KR018_004731, partial [Drosophila ironensis]